MRDIKKVLESQVNTHNMVEVQKNLESRSLITSPTRSPGPPCLQIDIQNTSNKTDKEITFLMSLVSWSTKIGVECSRSNKTDLHNLPGVAPPILGRWSVYQVGVR
jgi:hypothetical protein